MRYRVYVMLTVALAACSPADDGRGGNDQKFGTLSLFDPVRADPTLASPIIPFPFDGLFSGFNDPTLNIPNAGAVPFVTAANLTDGFSTSASIFTDLVGFVDYSTAAEAVILIDSSTGRRLQAGVDFTVQPSVAVDASAPQVPINQKRSRLLIEPLRPLAPSTTYLVAITTDLKSTDGLTAAASDLFKVVRSDTPVADQDAPVLDVLSPLQLGTLEVLRAQLIRPAVAGIGALTGLAETDLVLAWSFTTQSVAKTLQRIDDAAAAQAIGVADTGMTTGDLGLGLPPNADIHAGTFTLPYFLSNSGGNAFSTAPLTDFWLADAMQPDVAASFLGLVPCGAFAAGVTLPDGQTAQPSVSTTTCFPVPVKRSDETVPLVVTVPNSTPKPASGWPVVVFQHGITGNRTQMFAIAPALAAAGFVTVAIDLPLHGLPPANPFFSGIERTFGLDLVNNATSAPGPDGTADPSGTHFINLSSLITSRDNLRQAASDLIHLVKSVNGLNLDGDGGTDDIDETRIYFVGMSLGGIVGTPMLGVNSDVRAATLAVTGGGVARLLDASKSFGPRIAAGLAASGVIEGTDNYETFLRFAQHLVDPGDPINFAAAARENHAIHLIEVIGDTVVPNDTPATSGTDDLDRVTIAGFLSGTDPLYQVMGLDVAGPVTPPIATPDVRTDAAGLGVVVKFSIGNHGSLLDPTESLPVTAEMQNQTAQFLASDGKCLPIGGNCS